MNRINRFVESMICFGDRIYRPNICLSCQSDGFTVILILMQWLDVRMGLSVCLTCIVRNARGLSGILSLFIATACHPW